MEGNRIIKLHNELFEILSFVADFCDRNDIQYFLFYGTALGAFRHEGFIPWDDDVDIAMPRDDYEKFLNLFNHSDTGVFNIQNEENEDNYFLTFSKVRKKGTTFIENNVDVSYKDNGIYIDIFPLDPINDTGINFNIIRRMVKILIHIVRFNSCKSLYKNKKNKLKFILDYLICLPFSFISNRKMLFLINKLKKKLYCEKKYCKYYVEFDENVVIDKKIIGEGRKLNFENVLFYVPKQIEEYLKIIYGDTYMELPPENKRATHDPKVLEFEKMEYKR